MKSSLLFSLLLLSYTTAFSQQKHDYNWFLASNPSSNPEYGVCKIDFNSGLPVAEKIEGFDIDLHFANASWSNSEGIYKLLANGCVINDSQFSIVENAEEINPGYIHDIYCGEGFPVSQSQIFLSRDLTDHVVWLLHLNLDNLPLLSIIPTTLLFSKVSLLPNEANMAEEVNEIVIQDTLCKGQLTAVKHANGMDWWAVVPESGTNGYYIVLADSIGPYVYRKQFVGTVQNPVDWGGQAVFSPDGRFYARAESHNGLEVMSFDRCHGAFYAPRHVDPPLDSGGVLYSVAISPNSRYLYVSSQVVLLQYDLLADDLAASVDTVGVYDGFESWLPARFFGMQLAPDGKIYMTTSNGTNVLHVIQRPDEPGDSCLFQQHAVTLPTYYNFSPPNFPNYRLGPAPEGYCDSVTATVGQHLPPAAPGLAVAPNPASGHFTAALPSAAPGLLTLLSQLGTVAAALPIQAGDRTVRVDLSGLPPGVYFCRVEQEGWPMHVATLIISQ